MRSGEGVPYTVEDLGESREELGLRVLPSLSGTQVTTRIVTSVNSLLVYRKKEEGTSRVTE